MCCNTHLETVEHLFGKCNNKAIAKLRNFLHGTITKIIKSKERKGKERGLKHGRLHIAGLKAHASVI